MTHIFKPVHFILLFLVGWMQYQLWFSEGNLRDMWALQQQVREEQAQLSSHKQKNQAMLHTVQALRYDPASIEALARAHYDMIKPGERYIQLINSAAESSESTL